ncbi:LAMT/FAMT [Ilex paraguariensis]|uniref:LAMT/FAMT protein n=1 Tax=Ilex paraguariensis TaxID=185542 RepID=A0ABC8RK04_9AQUA
MYSFASISSFSSLPPSSLAIGRHVLPYPVGEHGIARYTMLHGPRQSRSRHPHHVISLQWRDLLSPHANTSLGRPIRVNINIDQDLKPCVEDERAIKLPKSYAMNGGDGNYSYAQNSSYQRGAVDAAKELIKEGVAAKLDIKQLSSSSSINPFCIADFGCSTGPNTLLAVQVILEAVEQKFKSEKPTAQLPEFQVFFNDHVLNDFNTLFQSLPPERRYRAAGVAGSFYGRVLPKASLHFAFSSSSLCWISELPEEILDSNSPAWNKGRIHYTGARKEVSEAYALQYAKDLEAFLHARAEELVGGGLMALLVPAVPNVMTSSETTIGTEIDLLGSCLMDMAKMGSFSEAKVDSFNLPLYFPPIEELEASIEANTSFSIERMEILNNPPKHVAMPSVRHRTLFFRACFEGLLENHFGSHIMDELFERYSKKVAQSSFTMNPDNDKSIFMLVLLKRKSESSQNDSP